MKRKIKLTLLPLLIATLSGCQNSKEADIVASSFIGYDLATMIVKEKMSVRNVIPWGGELHDYEPTPREIGAINNAKLFIYTSNELEPWIKGLVSQPNALALSDSYELLPYNHDEMSEETPSDHNHSSLHFWTDPTNYLQLINKVRDYIIELDPVNSSYYTSNALEYYESIEATHIALSEYRDNIDKPTLFFAGHNALDAFSNRYDLTIRALSESYKPDAVETPIQLENLINEVVNHDVHYLFIEELAEPKVALQIKNELSKRNYELTLLELHSYHNITKSQAKDGINYGNLFAKNFANIRQAIGN